MTNIIVELSKYFMIICIAFYTLHGFIVFRYNNEADRNGFYLMQNLFMILIHLSGYVVLSLQTEDKTFLIFYAMQQILIIAIMTLYRIIYPLSNRLIINNMCMLLTVSFIILARLSYDKCMKQFMIVVAGLTGTMIIPYLVRFLRFWAKKCTYVFGLFGILVLGGVLALGSATNGSKISFTVHGITFQPSELIKIVFVIFVAAMFAKSTSFKKIVVTTVFAGAHIGILALSKDLGSALIFFIVYLVMLYVATNRIRYLFLGLISGAGACYAGYRLFSHVRTRVIAWLDPFSVIEGQGYQITQSLFAMGTGSWFGMGLYQGSPNKIPVVEADFIFSAISEEMGCLFSLCLILICISIYLMFMNIAMKIKDDFFRYVSLGLATIYGFQMFLTIGGVTKFIPLTGVTLPLVSYGGTSVLVTLVMFSIIQGIYILRNNSVPNFSMERSVRHSNQESDDEIDDEEYDADYYEDDEGYDDEGYDDKGCDNENYDDEDYENYDEFEANELMDDREYEGDDDFEYFE